MLARIFDSHNIAAVVHFAGLKSVEESVNNSALYFRNNVAGSACL
jgi:UDP-glucose 4-epimerase